MSLRDLWTAHLASWAELHAGIQGVSPLDWPLWYFAWIGVGAVAIFVGAVACLIALVFGAFFAGIIWGDVVAFFKGRAAEARRHKEHMNFFKNRPPDTD